LMNEGLVVERPAAQPTGRGRPRVGLELRPDALLVAGIKLKPGSITTALLDLRGAVIGQKTVSFGKPTIRTDELVNGLMTALQLLLADHAFTTRDLDVVGIGVPGYVDLHTGEHHWSPILRGTPVNVRDLVSQHLDCPLFIDNDANLATLAELWFGLGRKETDFLVVTIEHGVGMGIVIDGQLFRGARGLGAEFGHIKVQVDGALCRCGQRGCLEAYVADYALVREAKSAFVDSAPDETVDSVLSRLADRAADGDPMPRAVFEHAGRMLGIGIANLVNLFDPHSIILAGTRFPAHQLIADELDAVIRANTVTVDRPPVRLVVHRWDDDLWARGAGALAIDGVLGQMDRGGGAEEISFAI
ncbi:MAG: ROK family protein, partial [Pseudomonadota bacterium]